MYTYHFLNAVMILSGIAAMIKTTHVVAFLGPIPFWSFLIAAALAFGAKSYYRSQRPAEVDPLMQKRIPRMVFFIAMSVLMVALVIRLMRWPGAEIALFVDAAIQLTALILSFTAKDTIRRNTEDILDAE